MAGYMGKVDSGDIPGVNDVYGNYNAAIIGSPEEIFATTKYFEKFRCYILQMF